MHGYRSPVIAWMLCGAVLAAVAGPGLYACASSGVPSELAPSVGPDLAPDNSIVILRVVNYQSRDVLVLLHAGEMVRRVGTVGGMRWSFFVLTSAALGGITEFAVLAIPVGGAVEFAETDRIKRQPGKLVLVTISMGQDSERPIQHRTAVIAAAVPRER